MRLAPALASALVRKSGTELASSRYPRGVSGSWQPSRVRSSRCGCWP